MRECSEMAWQALIENLLFARRAHRISFSRSHSIRWCQSRNSINENWPGLGVWVMTGLSRAASPQVEMQPIAARNSLTHQHGGGKGAIDIHKHNARCVQITSVRAEIISGSGWLQSKFNWAHSFAPAARMGDAEIGAIHIAEASIWNLVIELPPDEIFVASEGRNLIQLIWILTVRNLAAYFRPLLKLNPISKW